MAVPSSTPLERCARCPRLVALRREVLSRHPDYHAAPVPAWGSRRARMLIVGLAPGMHGANRTGRPFTGDASGDFLFRALHRAGFADSDQAVTATLLGCRITNAVKCLPPENRPVAKEIANCAPYLVEELAELCGVRPRRPRVILCLGRLAHEAVVKTVLSLAMRGAAGSILPFGHGRCAEISPRTHLLDTYHPSRQNTNTGRLTERMLDEVMLKARELLVG
jgi:uracil-DNA glycosylase family 4